ncbi:MAG TPA: secretin N-terminal domain-containing protein, partial [Vicinamibacterales bacterium]|nr:secretin N-terminal domain-containing protein [Vicinamibacterales bacterium]
MRHSLGRLSNLAAIVALAAVLGGCASGRAFRRGDNAARAGDWDAAVEQYRQAVQEQPENTEYKITLERAMLNASVAHLDQARIFEAKGQLEDALREYRRASDLDPPNRQIAGKVTEMEHRIRDQAEASQPKPTIDQLRQAARQAGPPPLVNLTTPLPILRYQNTSLRDILNSIGQAAGINVTFDPTFADRLYTVQMDNATLQEALNQIMQANQLFYKVMNPRTILVSPDTQAKHNQYDEQVIRTFFISHADASELAQTINTVIRVGGGQVNPQVTANKTANTITIRATAAVADIIEKIIETNDTPRAEIVVDVQILEVNRSRTKQFGLDLSQYAINGVFSPETSPIAAGTAASGATAATAPTLNPQPFNLNTVSRGVNTADFYLAVPSAVVRFLESDTETKLVAKPQLRGSEGQKLELNLGEDIPVPSTTFTPLAAGGATFNPLTSFTYRTVGLIVTMTPRVTFEDDVILDLTVESSARGADVNIAGQNLPSFTTRKVATRLRLRDGESNLLAGLLQDNERKALSGLPGLIHIPILRSLFAANDNQIQQTDIVMLLTPRIIRTHELTQEDVSPIYIGTAQNLGLGGAPPLIAQPEPAASQPA